MLVKLAARVRLEELREVARPDGDVLAESDIVPEKPSRLDSLIVEVAE